MLNAFNIFVGLLTIVGFVLTLKSLYKEETNNRIRRKRTEDILQENIDYNSKKIKNAYGKFNHNLNNYNEAINVDPKSEYGHRIDLITYFIQAYGNVDFLHTLKDIRNNIESYYINNIDDSTFDYEKYFDLKGELNELIKKLEYYKYQIDIFIEPYDEFLKYNLKQKISYNQKEITNDLITNNFNDTGNDSIVNPTIYHNSIIRKYDEYFSDFKKLPVPLMTVDEDMFVKSFIDIDFSSVHEEINNIISKIDENINWGLTLWKGKLESYYLL